jgi:subtilisin family serine protease
MDADRNLDHLALSAWSEPAPRRKRRGGGGFTREDRFAHGQEISRQIVDLSAALQSRVQGAPPQINPKLIFKLRLHPRGNLNDGQIRQLGLHVLGREPNDVTVVFPDDATLQELRRRVREYARISPTGHSYDYLGAIDEVAAISPQEKLGARLRREPLGPDEVAALDVELWHTGNQEECRRFIAQLGEFLGGRTEAISDRAITDSYVGTSICLARARMTAASLNDLLNSNVMDFVKQIDRRPQPSFELVQLTQVALPNIQIESEYDVPPVGLLIIDSGVMQAHPLLAPAIGDAQVFRSQLTNQVQGDASDGDQAMGGHGTAVGGIAVYGDILACVAKRVFRPQVQLFSARVTDAKNEYDEEALLEHQLADAVEYFVQNYPSIRVINISLGDNKLVYAEGGSQFRFAAAIDELAYKYREHNLVFVVSAGNYWPSLDDEEIKAKYPAYLLDSGEARLIDPATAALALTVGGLSNGPARDPRGLYDRGTEQLVAGERGWPSPFTRTGWGVGAAIKPDVVELAGDWRFERGRVPWFPAAYAGLPTTAKNFAPPDGQLLRSVAGTSFAAPKVANVAARLFQEFPDASANLIRALIATSARVPSERPNCLSGLDPWHDDALRVYGYGQPDFDRAAWSARNEVLFLLDSQIGLDSFVLFDVPALPDEFLTTRGERSVTVALAFDPPTRHTRADNYLGVSMGIHLFKNADPGRIADALRNLSPEERQLVGDGDIQKLGDLNRFQIKMRPNATRLRKGTLQRASFQFTSHTWKYDGRPLVLAVYCQRNWAPPDIADQRFAVVVSVAHESPLVDLYATLRQQARAYQRARIQLSG